MNKSDLVDAVAGSADMSKAEAGRAVEAVLDGITNALHNGDPVQLVGFGTFSVRHRKARDGRNPSTGDAMHIAASNPLALESRLIDKSIIEILQNYEKILEIILPTLRKERRGNYSPFLPLSEVSGNVLQVQIDVAKQTVKTQCVFEHRIFQLRLCPLFYKCNSMSTKKRL